MRELSLWRYSQGVQPFLNHRTRYYFITHLAFVANQIRGIFLLLFLSLINLSTDRLFAQNATYGYDGPRMYLKKIKDHIYFVNENGERLSKTKFEDARLFVTNKDWLTPVKVKGRWGYVNRSLEMAIAPNYNFAGNFNGSDDIYRGIVKKEGKYFLIDPVGEIASQPYDSIAYLDGHFVVKEKGQYGLITALDSLILPIEFQNIGKYSTQEIIVKKRGKWGRLEHTHFVEEDIVFSNVQQPAQYRKYCYEIREDQLIGHGQGNTCAYQSLLYNILRIIKYPEEAKNLGIQGRVIVKVVVDEKGIMRNPVVTRGIGGGCDEEVIRVLTDNEQLVWENPAIVNGEFVKSYQLIPVTFRL